MQETIGYAAKAPHTPLEPFVFNRRDVGDHDVAIEILFCGICHSDLHQINNDWGFSQYPMVPGHEIVGRVTKVGKAVSQFAKGDTVGVGCMVDSCRECTPCKAHEEQFCEAGNVQTYNAPDKTSGGRTYGGYSKEIVVTESCVFACVWG
ncbi:MAG: alcohol dehydrogenase catalytic domain-containing protein, partial [Legionellaceae bacterium]|nr:alcohol dehydrogenase catalytic domain-containing protein [Legionellaceae bacterium]